MRYSSKTPKIDQMQKYLQSGSEEEQLQFGYGFRAWGLGFGIEASGCSFKSMGCMTHPGLGGRAWAQGLGLRVEGSGFRV